MVTCPLLVSLAVGMGPSLPTVRRTSSPDKLVPGRREEFSELDGDAEAPGAVAEDELAALVEVVQIRPAILGEEGGALDARVPVCLAGQVQIDGVQVHGEAQRGGVA